MAADRPVLEALAIVRRLAQQQAPAPVVRAACLQVPDWAEPQGQAALLQALAEDPDSAAVDAKYRQRVLKEVVGALEHRRVELHEPLLEAYLADLAAAPPSSRWTQRTYEVAPGERLRLRVHDGIGGGTETGGMVWGAALVLCAWLLLRPADELAGLDVLELGAGTGLCGLALAQCRGVRRVVLTDVVPATLDNLRHNAALLPPAAAARCAVAPLDWCDPSSPSGAPPALLLGADLVYEPALVAPLVGALAALLTPSARALVASVRRTETWDLFVRELGEKGLRARDRTPEAHGAMAARDCPFWLDEAEVGRVYLLEITCGEPLAR